MHALLRHILLCENYGKLFCAVVAEVEENDNVALLDSAVNLRIVNWLDELVGNAIGITLFHCLNHVVSLLSLALNEQVISFLYTLPTLVAVHCIETSHDAGDGCAVVITYVLKLLNEANATLRVGVTTIHEAVNEHFLQTILLANLNEFIQMIE